MTSEKTNKEFRLKKIDETRNYYLEEIKQKWSALWKAQTF